jgi:hypothetical protein
MGPDIPAEGWISTTASLTGNPFASVICTRRLPVPAACAAIVPGSKIPAKATIAMSAKAPRDAIGDIEGLKISRFMVQSLTDDALKFSRHRLYRQFTFSV